MTDKKILPVKLSQKISKIMISFSRNKKIQFEKNTLKRMKWIFALSIFVIICRSNQADPNSLSSEEDGSNTSTNGAALGLTVAITPLHCREGLVNVGKRCKELDPDSEKSSETNEK